MLDGPELFASVAGTYRVCCKTTRAHADRLQTVKCERTAASSVDVVSPNPSSRSLASGLKLLGEARVVKSNVSGPAPLVASGWLPKSSSDWTAAPGGITLTRYAFAKPSDGATITKYALHGSAAVSCAPCAQHSLVK